MTTNTKNVYEEARDFLKRELKELSESYIRDSERIVRKIEDTYKEEQQAAGSGADNGAVRLSDVLN